MPVDTTWTDPSTGGAIDLATDQVATETVWDKVLSDLKHIGGVGGLTWTDFTPTLAQGAGLTITVTYARYAVIGKTAIVQCRLVLSSAGTANNAIVLSAIPAAIASRQSGVAHVGSGLYSDSGTETIPIVVTAESATQFQFWRGYGTAVPSNPLGTTAGQGPTAASGDILTFTAIYELA